jgi:hypothetical protein
MTREELEHIIRASGDITGQYEFIIVGSQAILGPVPSPKRYSRSRWRPTSTSPREARAVDRIRR